MGAVRILVVDGKEDLRSLASGALSADGPALAAASDRGSARVQIAEDSDLIGLEGVRAENRLHAK